MFSLKDFQRDFLPEKDKKGKKKKLFVTIMKSWKVQTFKTKFKEETSQSDFKA